MGLFSSNDRTNMKWIPLTDIETLETIKEESNNQSVLIFKHSIRCAISMMAKNRLDTAWKNEGDNMKAYYLDLIRYRTISDRIEKEFAVRHESPQVLVIKNGECTYSVTHSNINPGTIKQAL